MKKHVWSILGLLLWFSSALLAQSSDAQGRDIVYNFGKPHQPGKVGRPGLRVRIERLRDGKREFVSPQTVFRSGDQVRFHFAVNFPGYVAVINQGSTGKVSLLAPQQGAQLRVRKTADYAVPNGRAWFRFDDTAGEEKLTFIVSPQPIKEVTALRTRPGSRALEAEALLPWLEAEESENSRDLQLHVVGTDGYAVGASAAARTYRVRLTLRHR
jgi:hypothetical protein